MKNFSLAVAAFDYLNQLPGSEAATPRIFSKDIFITLGALIAASVLLLLLVLLLRRKKIRLLGNLSRSAWPASASKNQKINTALSLQQHHYPKKRRRKHRPRNPTLCETSGLPPKRPGTDML